jgi:hypothetical protein
MVEITQTFLINVDADSAREAERITHEMFENGDFYHEYPTSYRVEDRGSGSWDD